MTTALEIGLFTAVTIILYTFFGYPALICLLARLWPRPVKKANITPTVTLLIPAYNETSVIAEKLENSLALDYPANRLGIVVVADGSTDETTTIVASFADRGIRLLFEPERRGKITAVNRAMPLLASEIVVFTDANAMLDRGTLKALTRNFADTAVAAVAGAKRVLSGGEGLYWRYESHIKRCDSQLSSVMGAAGELFAIRRALFASTETDSIIEDFVMSMRLVGNGWRVVYEPEAVAREESAITLRGDWQRRTRIATGGFQAIRRLPQLLHPRQGRIAWQYISHRVLRWAATPFLLPLVYLLNLALWERPFYQLLLLGQTAFYMMGLWGFWRAKRGIRRGLSYAVFFFCFTNLAAIVGFWRYITDQQPVTWAKTR